MHKNRKGTSTEFVRHSLFAIYKQVLNLYDMNKKHRLQASTEIVDMFAKFYSMGTIPIPIKKYFQEELEPDEEQSNFKATQK